ncbi:hypothetical protein [Streptomyces sp. NRRL S-237]|uniref:hypothetical protein n=1 Tax=Streptomyces sp. NRRL S-237 TaxID=1463895 RepID=UPI001F38BAB4|nr:hypothetical protein [Streptomyces sp. NRRL S-237]
MRSPLPGKGAAGLLGSARLRPEFRMLSLDGNVLCFATTWQHSISTPVLTAPHRSRVLRRFAEWVAQGAMDRPNEPPLSTAVRRWLDTSSGWGCVVRARSGGRPTPPTRQFPAFGSPMRRASALTPQKLSQRLKGMPDHWPDLVQN